MAITVGDNMVHPLMNIQFFFQRGSIVQAPRPPLLLCDPIPSAAWCGRADRGVDLGPPVAEDSSEDIKGYPLVNIQKPIENCYL